MKFSPENKFDTFKGKTVCIIAVIAFYFIGMILMIFGLFGQGVSLWFLSTVGGAVMLYVKKRQDKKVEDLKREEEEERAYQEKMKAEAEKQEQN